MAPDAADPPDDDEVPPSFFALLLERTHDPYRFPPTVVGYEDDQGPYDVELTVELDVPDDAAVAALDQATSALGELAILAGDQYDDVLDVLEAAGTSPVTAADDVLAHFHLDRPPVVGWLELAERINVYGRGLQYDLFERGHRLSDYFAGLVPGGFDELLEVAERLPAGSHYRSAMLSDDDLAARVAAQYGPPSKRPKGSSRPALEGFTTEVAYLHRIDNRLHFLGWAIFAAAAGKKRGNPPRPAKGPETADDRYEFADFMREHDEIVAQVLVNDDELPGPPTLPDGPSERVPAPEAVRGAIMLDQPD